MAEQSLTPPLNPSALDRVKGIVGGYGIENDETLCATAGDLRALLSRIEQVEAENARLRKPDRDAMANRTDDQWEAIEEAIMRVYGLREGHTLDADDIAALNLVDATHRDDEEGATEAYNRGLENGRRERGGDELVKLNERHDSAIIDKMTERAMRAMAERRADDAESQASLYRKALEEILDGLVASRNDISVDDWIEIARQALSLTAGQRSEG